MAKNMSRIFLAEWKKFEVLDFFFPDLLPSCADPCLDLYFCDVCCYFRVFTLHVVSLCSIFHVSLSDRLLVFTLGLGLTTRHFMLM